MSSGYSPHGPLLMDWPDLALLETMELMEASGVIKSSPTMVLSSLSFKALGLPGLDLSLVLPVLLNFLHRFLIVE